MKQKTPAFVFLMQVLIGLVFLYVGISKFLQTEISLYIFTKLDMEPQGRYLIGSIEILSGLLLLSRMAALGAFIGLATMLGALIGHITQLGIVVQNDGGTLFLMMLFLLISSAIILWYRRKELPMFGASF